MMQLPVMTAGATLPTDRMRGKFQGQMAGTDQLERLRFGVGLLTTAHAEGRVLGVDVLLLILEVLVGHVEGQVEADEGANGADLEGGSLLL